MPRTLLCLTLLFVLPPIFPRAEALEGGWAWMRVSFWLFAHKWGPMYCLLAALLVVVHCCALIRTMDHPTNVQGDMGDSCWLPGYLSDCLCLSVYLSICPTV